MSEKKQPRFEEAMERIEQIVSLLEKGDAPLEQALLLYQEGTGLIARCSALLDEAELQIRQLTPSPEGELREESFAHEDLS